MRYFAINIITGVIVKEFRTRYFGERYVNKTLMKIDGKRLTNKSLGTNLFTYDGEKYNMV